VREGLTLAIVGRPNVGKSSLFNRLLNEERAIVTAIPGTTRDLVAETANLGGIPLRFVDTAGIREAQDEVEKIGVERTFGAIADSDLRLLVVDASEPWTEDDSRLLEKLRPLGSLLIALNKSDLPGLAGYGKTTPLRLITPLADNHPIRQLTDTPPESGGELLKHSPPQMRRGGAPSAGVVQSADLKVGATPHEDAPPVGAMTQTVRTSALTGEGLPELKEKILALAVPARDIGLEGEFITNLRHQQHLKNSLAALAKARQAAEQHTPHEMLLLDLHDALRPLDLITGATYADDILDIIFKTFCVGK
jgi:tRNA modification GTPase